MFVYPERAWRHAKDSLQSHHELAEGLANAAKDPLQSHHELAEGLANAAKDRQEGLAMGLRHLTKQLLRDSIFGRNSIFCLRRMRYKLLLDFSLSRAPCAQLDLSLMRESCAFRRIPCAFHRIPCAFRQMPCARLFRWMPCARRVRPLPSLLSCPLTLPSP